MKNVLIDSPRGRMTILQFKILEVIAKYPNAPDKEIAEALETSVMHVGRTRKRFLPKKVKE